MFLEGFIRSLQAELMTAAFVLLIILVAYIVLQRTVKDDNVKLVIRKVAEMAALVVVALFLLRAVSMGITNRAPRQDVDKSGVYEQMKQNTR